MQATITAFQTIPNATGLVAGPIFGRLLRNGAEVQTAVSTASSITFNVSEPGTYVATVQRQLSDGSGIGQVVTSNDVTVSPVIPTIQVPQSLTLSL